MAINVLQSGTRLGTKSFKKPILCHISTSTNFIGSLGFQVSQKHVEAWSGTRLFGQVLRSSEGNVSTQAFIADTVCHISQHNRGQKQHRPAPIFSMDARAHHFLTAGSSQQWCINRRVELGVFQSALSQAIESSPASRTGPCTSAG